MIARTNFNLYRHYMGIRLVFIRALTVISLLCFSKNPIFGQKMGFQAGLTVNIGTHVSNIGVNTNLYLTDHFFQFNVNTSTKFNFYTYGKRKNAVEHRLALGLLLLGGKKTITPDFHFDGLNHQSNYQNAIGFNYLWYFDDKASDQRSGAWSIHHNYFSILFENDVFGGQAKDRFRSGILQFNYRYRDFKYFTNLFIWTGETAKSIWIKDSIQGCPNGYRSLANLPFGKTSHGIWSFGSHYNAPNRQLLTAKLGVDSEQIRHVIQNRISHDLIFLPKKIQRNTPHYPRLDQLGNPTFSRKLIRANKLYFQASLNELWSN